MHSPSKPVLPLVTPVNPGNGVSSVYTPHCITFMSHLLSLAIFPWALISLIFLFVCLFYFRWLNVHVCLLSCFIRVWLFVTPWAVAGQALLSMGFSRQEYWDGLPVPPPGDLPDSGTEPASPASPALQVDSLPLWTLGNNTAEISTFCWAANTTFFALHHLECSM